VISKIDPGTVQIGIPNFKAKSTVIKLHDHFAAQGINTASAHQATSLFLCGNVYVVGDWSSFRSEIMSHHSSTTFSKNNRSRVH
jgi:hypothetical protein